MCLLHEYGFFVQILPWNSCVDPRRIIPLTSYCCCSCSWRRDRFLPGNDAFYQVGEGRKRRFFDPSPKLVPDFVATLDMQPCRRATTWAPGQPFEEGIRAIEGSLSLMVCCRPFISFHSAMCSKSESRMPKYTSTGAIFFLYCSQMH